MLGTECRRLGLVVVAAPLCDWTHLTHPVATYLLALLALTSRG
jgi:hypothetical protein